MARKKKFRPPRVTTVIGQNAKVEGNISFSGGLHIDGRVIGNLVSDPDIPAALILSEKGFIDGDIRVSNVILNGEVKGNVTASEHVELAEMARITGDVSYAILEMEQGAMVNGKLLHIDEIPRRLAFDGEELENSPPNEDG